MTQPCTNTAGDSTVSKETLAMGLMLAEVSEGSDNALGIIARSVTSPQMIEHLLTTDLPDDALLELAQNVHTPAEALDKLARSAIRYGTSSLPERVAANPAASPATLAMLAESPHQMTRSSVAENPSTAPETLAILARDSEYGVHSNVAENPNTPVELLLDMPGTATIWNGRLLEVLPELTEGEIAVATTLARDWGGSLRELFDIARASCSPEATLVTTDA